MGEMLDIENGLELRVAIQGYRTDGTVFYWNRDSEKVYGYTAAEALGRNLGDLIIPDKLRPEFRKSLKRGRAVREFREFYPPGELVLKNKAGQPVPVYSTHIAVPVGDETFLFCVDLDRSSRAFEASYRSARERLKRRILGRTRKLRSVNAGLKREIRKRERIIKERGEFEEQIRQAQKMEMAAALAGGLAHDFGNLLNAIRGYVEVIREQIREEDPLRKDIAGLDRAVAGAGTLVRKLFAIGRREPSRTGPVDLHRLCEDLAPMLRRVCGRRIRLNLDLEPGLREVSGDRGDLEQVIINLVLNARDAITGEGKISIAARPVELGSTPVARMIGKQPGPYVALSVADTGRGMSPAEKARLFEPFFSTKETAINSGLGMAVIYGIVERDGGFIQVDTSPGKGTTFTVYLPVRGETAAPAGRSRLLLMDDDENFRKLTARILNDLGYETAAVSDGGPAVELYRQELEAGRPFDAVLLDLLVPGDRSGAETLYRLREIDPGVKAVLCSGYTADPLMEEFREHGFAAALGKPFRVEELRETLTGIGVPPPADSGSSPGPEGGCS